MELTPSIKLNSALASPAGSGSTSAVLDERIVMLSSWIMVLGTVRLLCAVADALNALVGLSRFQPISPRLLGTFIEGNQPLLVLSSVWPLVLGVILRRTRWPELVPAAAVTFMILALGGVLGLVAQSMVTRSDGLTFGSFHLTRQAVLHPRPGDVALGILGTAQLVFELVVAIRGAQLALRLRHARTVHAGESDKHDAARRARLGRLAIYGSLGFLVLMVRFPVWAAYLEVLNDSKLVREFVLGDDLNRGRSACALLEHGECQRWAHT